MGGVKDFFRQIDTARLEAAITAAERRTSGEVRVVLVAGKVDDPTAQAAREFTRLGMRATAERNGVLLLVAPDARQFAIYGDEGVHQRCGEVFWVEVAATMEARFRAGDATGALVEGIDRAGALLAREFPRADYDRNELPDTIERRSPEANG